MSETSTQALADWLLAQIAEDERVAREAHDEMVSVKYLPGHEPDPEQVGELWVVEDAMVPHVGASPARVLADCEAKRKILAVAVELAGWAEMGSATDEDGNAILYALAQPYRDRDGFRDEWVTS